MSPLTSLRRHRETIGLWVLALVFASACVLLGRWQLHRYQDKHERTQLVSRNYDAPPVPLRTLLPSAATPLDPGLQWRRVTATGTYDVAGTTLVRNRPWTGPNADATYGYEVVVPLRLADGSALLVDRGWIPSGSGGGDPGRAPDSVPAPPSGPVNVVARLRPSERTRETSLPRGQVSSVSVARIGEPLGYPVLRAYGALASESPSRSPAPQPLDPPERDGSEGINASYAVQWVLFALLGLGFPVWVARRRRAVAAELAADVQADRAAPDGRAAGDAHPPRPQGPGTPPDRPLEPARPRKRRIWDADDE